MQQFALKEKTMTLINCIINCPDDVATRQQLREEFLHLEIELRLDYMTTMKEVVALAACT